MSKLFLTLLAMLGLAGPAPAQYIDIRVSMKVILHPTTGARPGGISNEVFYLSADHANEWMAAYQRGYRYRITEITNIGGPSGGGASGPSKYYGTDFRDNPAWNQFQTDAQGSSLYRLRSDQINCYVATGFSSPGNSGGGTPIPPGDMRTAVQIFADDGAWWMCHELGHFFGLYHTFAGQNQSACVPGDDGLSDTLQDSGCWTNRDQVAQYHYSQPYSALNAAQQTLVNDTYFNVMSYHEAVNKNTVENRMTELQLDTFSTIANTPRYPFVSGRTRYLSTTGVNIGSGTNNVSPLRTVAYASGIASAGQDILLLRPGNYNEQITLNKGVTLRVPRTGWATIGKP
jgi:hypothetical protein